MEWITTTEAAERLKVTPLRIRQYIDEGRLEAQKFGPLWMVSEESVNGFKKRPTGRPPADAKPAQERKAKSSRTRDHPR